MGKIIQTYFVPHPPVLIPEIGSGREQEVSSVGRAMRKIAKEIEQLAPSVIIISTPHAPSFRDYYYINSAQPLQGSFANFGEPQLNFSLENDLALARLISQEAQKAGIDAGFIESNQLGSFGLDQELDHGALVPLYFISQTYAKFKLVILSTPFRPSQEIYRFGQCISQALSKTGQDAVYVASGDLSHALNPGAPAGYRPQAQAYDDKIRRIIENNDIDSLLQITAADMEEAAECGTRSLIMLYGALSAYRLQSKVYAYEGIFGVGYLCASIKPTSPKKENIQKEASEHVQLAKAAVTEFVKNKLTLEMPPDLSAALTNTQAGAFVTLKIDGRLRGCIGTILPVRENLAQEIIDNAISAASTDPRFPAVSEHELKSLSISVDVLGQAEKIKDLSELDVKKYGIIVSSGLRRGLLLPALDGVDSVELQLSIALEKAGIDANEEYQIERFQVTRYY